MNDQVSRTGSVCSKMMGHPCWFIIFGDAGAVWMPVNFAHTNAHFRFEVIVEKAFSDAAILR